MRQRSHYSDQATGWNILIRFPIGKDIYLCSKAFTSAIGPTQPSI